jgi:hypothetical protein
MLIDVDTLKIITKIPYENDYKNFRKKITSEEYQKIIDEINDIIDKDIDIGKGIQTAGWVPGNKWEGTVFEPISKAYGGDIEISSKIFGLIVWIVFMERDDKWGFGRYSVNEIPIKSMTYFKLKD